MLSTPDLILPEKPCFEYPDSFAMRLQYLEDYSIEHYVIRPKDTLLQVLKKLDLPAGCLSKWQASCRDYCKLGKLQPDDELTIHIRREDRQPVKFVYSSVDGSVYTFRKVGEDWECEKDRLPPFSVVQTVKGTISDNLFDSCVRSGLPVSLIMDLADLFAYDIDFMTDLQKGDRFAVHFEQQVREGKRIRVGPILGAEMMVNNKHYQAFHYKLPDGFEGYFDAHGKSLRKLFLKAPLSYSRISSTFTHKRFHPVLKIYRPHLGIDYAAPEGTPISSLANGTVTFLGWKGGFGRYVEIQHTREYKTAYGHLSRYAKGLKVGSKVNQGQVIGYVGASGLATGPHLDFRFLRNGKPVDFLKTEFPNARSIPKSLLPDFEKKREICSAAMRGEQISQDDALAHNK